ncbi:MAG: NAD-dependent epimerase/dehydratase family protein [Ignavibacteria bacterium]|nr:NAD-dependent epimerase/dehydratase family protein [Ignavibacteria bacterium]
MRILLTGATGFVGSVLLPLLVAKYGKESITVFVMPDDPFRRTIDAYDLRVVEGHVECRDDIFRAVDGSDVVIHLAGLISYWRRDKERLYSVNVQGVENIVQACLRFNVKRLIHISSVGAVGFHKKRQMLATEETPFNWPSSFHYMQSKRCGHEIVRKAMRDDGLHAVILCPASIMGPGDPNISTPHNQIYDRIYRGFLFGSFAGGLGIVDVRDVCAAIRSAVDRTDITGIYLVAGANVEYAKVIETIAAYAGKRSHVWPIKIPGMILSIAGGIMELASFLSENRPLISFAYGRLSGWHVYYSNKKSMDAFSLTYTPFESTIADSCRYFERAFLPECPA